MRRAVRHGRTGGDRWARAIRRPPEGIAGFEVSSAGPRVAAGVGPVRAGMTDASRGPLRADRDSATEAGGPPSAAAAGGAGVFCPRRGPGRRLRGARTAPCGDPRFLRHALRRWPGNPPGARSPEPPLPAVRTPLSYGERDITPRSMSLCATQDYASIFPIPGGSASFPFDAFEFRRPLITVTACLTRTLRTGEKPCGNLCEWTGRPLPCKLPSSVRSIPCGLAIMSRCHWPTSRTRRS